MSGAACDPCLRRVRIVQLVAGGIDLAYKQRRPVRDVLALDDDELLHAAGGRRAPALRDDLEATPPRAVREDAGARGLAALCRHDPDYPAALRDDRSAPAVLFVHGGGPGAAAQRLARLVGGAAGATGTGPPVVSIVGTRKASDDGVAIARTVARGLAAAGVTVVRGMALGIDSAAHAGALEVGGPTLTVLASGADVPYPPSKGSLYRALVRTQAVLSEMPPGFRPFRWCFPARNRTIAGLASLTIVVEAAERSGSLITAELAQELGRAVGAVPGTVLAPRTAGSNALLRDGAVVIRHAQDALDEALGIGVATALAGRDGSELARPLRALLARVEDGHDTVAALAATPAQAQHVLAGLAELELLGFVRRGPGGRYVRVL